MTTTFGGVTLVGAGKAKIRFKALTNETTLMSGKRYVQTNAQTGMEIEVEGLCTWAEFEAIVAAVGTGATLTNEYDSWSNCYITGEPEATESDAPGYFNYKVQFVRHTV